MADVFTVWDSDDIYISTGETEQLYSVILSDQIFNVVHNTEYLIWDAAGLNTIKCCVGYDEGTTIEIVKYNITYTIVWVGLVDDGERHLLSVTVEKDEDCEINQCGFALDDDLSETLYDKVNDFNMNPSGVWADFNPMHKRWRFYRNYPFLCPEYVADEVRIEDYLIHAAVGSGPVNGYTKRVTIATNDINVYPININIESILNNNDVLTGAQTIVDSAGYTILLSSSTGTYEYIGIEVESDAASTAALSEFIVQLKDHPDGEWYSWLGNADWSDDSIEPIMKITSTKPNTLAAGQTSSFRLNINKPYMLRLVAKTAALSALITCRGYVA